ncbi:MAG: ribosome-binding factor A [Anaerolineae bacterium]
MGKKYIQRVNELLRRKLTLLLLEESKDPRLAGVTITDVEVSRDTSRAEVYYSIIPPVTEEEGTSDFDPSPEQDWKEEKAAVQEALEGAKNWLRAQLAPTLRLRHVPELVFIYDDSLEHGARIEALLRKLEEES